MKYLLVLTILFFLGFSCAHPIESENEIEPAEKKGSPLEETTEGASHTMESLMHRENQVVSVLQEIASQLKTIKDKTISVEVPALSIWDLLPIHFVDYWEIIALFAHKKWHHQLIESIESVGEQVEQTGEKLEKIFEQPGHRQLSQSSLHKIVNKLAEAHRKTSEPK